jgi:hypothetical protein
MQKALFSNPFAKEAHDVQRILNMFWSRDIDALTHMHELHQSRRCQDPWLLAFLSECRNGRQSWMMYNFIHGFPTAVPGSWLPAEGPITSDELQTNTCAASGTLFGNVQCGVERCAKLATEVWPEMNKAGASWEAMRNLECQFCSAERERRHRVRDGDKDERQLSQPFVDAPFIHPFNKPKYHALLLRARRFAQSRRRRVLWGKAADKPAKGDIRELQGPALEHRKEQWLQLHDQQTSGIMGLLPLVKGMPIRFTNSIDRERGVFKHARGVLVGWELQNLDFETLQKSANEEHVLEFTPKRLFIQMPKTFGDEDTDRTKEDNVFILKPVRRLWYVDKGSTLGVSRFGFEILPDFGGTAHGYCGSTLQAAL